MPIAQGNYDMKNSVTAVYMKALAEKNLGELSYIILQDNHFKIFGLRRRTNRERKRNSEKLFQKVITCFSSVLFLVFSVPDGTLGLKDTERVGPSWLVQNNGFSASSIFS